MIFSEVESAILGGWGGALGGRYHTLARLHKSTVVCWMCVNVWRVEMAVRWKIDKERLTEFRTVK